MDQQNPLAMAAGNTLMLTVTLGMLGAVQQTLCWLSILLLLLSIFVTPNLTVGILLIVMSLGGIVFEVLKLGTEDKATAIAEELMASLTGGMGTVTATTPMQAPYDTEAAPSAPTRDWPTDQ